MKLYEIPRESKIYGFRIVLKDESEKDATITFHHLDGMYSYCSIDDLDEDDMRKIIHLSANTELKKVDNGYELI